jgi:hypothetical protein
MRDGLAILAKSRNLSHADRHRAVLVVEELEYLELLAQALIVESLLRGLDLHG